MNVTLSNHDNEISDPYLQLNPDIRRILRRMNELDEQLKELRTELNQEAEQWLKVNNRTIYWNIFSPEGPIIFYKRQNWRKGQTKVTHLRTITGVKHQIKKVLAYNK